MDVDVHLLIKVPGEIELTGPGPHVAHGSLGRLLHHIAQFPSNGEVPLSWHYCCLYMEHSAARLCPGKPCCNTNEVLVLCLAVFELGHTEVLLEGGLVDLYRPFSLFFPLIFHILLGHFPEDRGDRALEVSHPSLPGIGADDLEDRPLAELYLIGCQAVGL